MAWLVVMSAAAFVACVWDKRRAQRGRARIRERTLLGLGLVGGSPGLVLGMLLARHKARKPSFLGRLLVIALFQAGLVWLLFNQFP